MLSVVDLRNAILVEANLSKADLWSADLRRADLSKANLSGAWLLRADLRYANLAEVSLIGAMLKDHDGLYGLSEVNLEGANLTGARLDSEGPTQASDTTSPNSASDPIE